MHGPFSKILGGGPPAPSGSTPLIDGVRAETHAFTPGGKQSRATTEFRSSIQSTRNTGTGQPRY